MRRSLLIVSTVAGLVVVALAVYFGVTAYRTTATTVTATSTGGPKTTADSLSGVMATGSLIAIKPGNPHIGRVEVTADRAAQSFTMTLSGLAPQWTKAVHPQGSANFTTQAFNPVGDGCAPDGMTFSFGSIAEKARQSFPLPGAKYGGAAAENPSFYTNLTITEPAAGFVCLNQVVAYAVLHWTIGDIRPDIHVVDHGPRSGASGRATVGSSGQLLAYTVVANDNLTVIAKRFNLSLEQLFYLNPTRMPGSEDPTARAGETLNLSKRSR